MMTRVYGCSDDLVEIEGSTYKEDEIGCYHEDVLICFVDGTKIRVHYGKPGLAVWAIAVESKGLAPHTLSICEDENAETYSDVFEIAAEIRWHKKVRAADEA